MKGELGNHFCVVAEPEPDSIGSFQFFLLDVEDWIQLRESVAEDNTYIEQ